MKYIDFIPPQLDEVMKTQAEWANVKTKSSNPINTTIGVILDPNSGRVFQPNIVTESIHTAMQQIETNGDRGYQTQQGNSSYLKSLAEWVIGSHSPSWPQAQSLGGTGALHIANDLLSSTAAIKKLLVDPGWDNHDAIFSDFEINKYRRSSDNHPGYNHQEFIEALNKLPENSAVVMQAVGYNNDGAERSNEHWDEIVELIGTKGYLAVLDVAYFGLSSSFEQDNYAVRAFANSSIPSLVAISNSKNLGLYQERLGALYALNIPETLAKSWQAVINVIVRNHYSNPPRMIAQAAASILGNSELRQQLEAEVSALRQSLLLANRTVFAEILGSDFQWVSDTRGLFVKLFVEGFSEDQRDNLKSQGILVLPSSRINLGGIKPTDMTKFARAIKQEL